jgi:hypothetical protein
MSMLGGVLYPSHSPRKRRRSLVHHRSKSIDDKVAPLDKLLQRFEDWVTKKDEKTNKSETVTKMSTNTDVSKQTLKSPRKSYEKQDENSFIIHVIGGNKCGKRTVVQRFTEHENKYGMIIVSISNFQIRI